MYTAYMQHEDEFLADYDPELFERPSVAVDVALVTVSGDRLRVLLVRRPTPPHRGRWQLPGGFVRPDESLERTVERVLADKAGLRGVFAEQLYTFGKIDRDPRTRVLSVAHYALVDAQLIASGDVENLIWAEVSVPLLFRAEDSILLLDTSGKPLKLAFDHAEIVALTVQRLRGKLDYSPVGYELLPAEFTLLDLQRIHEVIRGMPLNKDSFRRRMLASGDLHPVGRRQSGVGHRPAALYRFTGHREHLS